MDDIHKALADITAIRQQMARTSEFRGYGPATLAVTGVLAALGAAAQRLWLQDPVSHIARYLTIWIVIAALAAVLIGVEMFTRSRRVHSALADEMIWMAVQQFLPAAAAGMLVTLVFLYFVPANLWMLPGLWQVVCSLGVFASCRFLPRLIFTVGGWYLFSGLACLAFAHGRWALSPWVMGFPFGVGQLMTAAILFFHAKEAHDEI